MGYSVTTTVIIHNFLMRFSVSLLILHSTETEPRCSSPADSSSSDADKQAKQNHDKSGEPFPASLQLSWLTECNPTTCVC